MPQAGAHAIIGMYLNRFFPKEKWLYAAIVFGAIIPDIDSLAVGFGILFTDLQDPVDFFHRKATHSFFLVILTLITGMIISEITHNPKYKIISRGLSIGIFSHIVVDTFLFFKGIYFLWPLNIKFNLWDGIYTPPIIIENLLMSLEFLFFRIYAWILIQFTIQSSSNNMWFHKPLIIWKYIEFWCFIIFTILAIINYSGFPILSGIVYIASLIMALVSTYIVRDVFQ